MNASSHGLDSTATEIAKKRFSILSRDRTFTSYLDYFKVPGAAVTPDCFPPAKQSALTFLAELVAIYFKTLPSSVTTDTYAGWYQALICAPEMFTLHSAKDLRSTTNDSPVSAILRSRGTDPETGLDLQPTKATATSTAASQAFPLTATQDPRPPKWTRYTPPPTAPRAFPRRPPTAGFQQQQPPLKCLMCGTEGHKTIACPRLPEARAALGTTDKIT